MILLMMLRWWVARIQCCQVLTMMRTQECLDQCPPTPSMTVTQSSTTNQEPRPRLSRRSRGRWRRRRVQHDPVSQVFPSSTHLLASLSSPDQSTPSSRLPLTPSPSLFQKVCKIFPRLDTTPYLLLQATQQGKNYFSRKIFSKSFPSSSSEDEPVSPKWKKTQDERSKTVPVPMSVIKKVEHVVKEAEGCGGSNVVTPRRAVILQER